MPGPSVRQTRNPFQSGPARVKFTIGAEAGNVIRVTAQLLMANRAAQPSARRQNVRAYLTQSLTTLAVAGTAPSGTVVIGTKGTIVVADTAKLAFQITADANGEFNLDITEAGVATWYLVVVNGTDVWASSAVTFA